MPGQPLVLDMTVTIQTKTATWYLKQVRLRVTKLQQVTMN